jgi:uncharacterized membrane protein YjfL (UPF0719 family)
MQFLEMTNELLRTVGGDSMNRQAALVSLVLTAAFLFVRELKFQYCLPYCFSSVQWSWQNIRNSNPTPVSPLNGSIFRLTSKTEKAAMEHLSLIAQLLNWHVFRRNILYLSYSCVNRKSDVKNG